MKKIIVKNFCVIMVLLVLISIFPLSSFAASYPSVYPKEYNQSAMVGDNVEIVYTYFPEFKNEKINVYVYNSDDVLVASAERTFYNTDSYYKTYTVTWDTTDYEPGRYKVVAHTYFYSYYEWHESPTARTSYITLKSDEYCKQNGHEFGNYIVVKEATCTESGLKSRECVNCGKKEEVTIDKTEHEYAKEVLDKETCTTAGQIRYTCSSCGYSYTESVDALGHSYSLYKTTEATCVIEGEKIFKCSRCGVTYSEKISCIPHSFNSSVTTAPTCQTEGIRTYVCTCGYSYTEAISKTEHQFGQWTVKTSPTCLETGVEQSVCTLCGDVIEREIPTIDHSIEYRADKSTLTQNGTRYGYCTICNETLSEELIACPTIFELSSTKCVYNGKVRTPSVTVKDAYNEILTEGVDYEVSYSEGFKLPGKYEITIEFMGDYSGTKTLYFTIVPKAVTNIKVSGQNATSLTLSWSKSTGATGYKVYKYNTKSKKYEAIKTTSSLSYKVTGLSSNTSYKFKVRAYTKTEDGTVLWGSYSDVFSASTKKGTGVEISPVTATIYVGGTKTLKGTTNPKNQTLTWKSSDTSIATVSSSGKVTAKKAGTVTITASFKYKNKTYKATCKITVKKPKVALNKTSASVTVGNSLALKATTAPSSASVTWKSSDTSVATVSSTGKVVGKKAGTATITASISYKGKTYKTTCKITVKKATTETNITKLVNYINKNGFTNSNGNKVIRIQNYNDDCEYTYAIVYDKSLDKLEFIMTIDNESLCEAITMLLNRKGTSAEFEATIVDVQRHYSASTEDIITPSNYYDEYDVFEYWNHNTFPKSAKEIIDDYLYTSLELAMVGWDKLVNDSIDIGLKDLGFKNYKY